jgi:cbb3-type cytochrome oxidase subunit 3
VGEIYYSFECVAFSIHFVLPMIVFVYSYIEFAFRPEAEEAAQPEDRTDTPKHHETD